MIACLVIGGGVALVDFAAVQRSKKYDQDVRRDNAEWVSKTKTALRAGKQSKLHFYSSRHTGEMVNEFAGMPEVTSMVFESTDLTDDGVKTIASLPNLSALTLYGGMPGVGNRGIRFLADHQHLAKLTILNTNVTDDGLAILPTLPALTELALERKLLTDTGMKHLSQLQGLDKLTVMGGEMRPARIEALRKALPFCEISTESEW
jgi:hypothetical protein